MGALEIRNAKLRCPRCLDIRRLLIIPSIRKPKIEIMCHCNKSIENLLDFFNEINKVTDIKPVCAKCGKELIKHPRKRKSFYFFLGVFFILKDLCLDTQLIQHSN